MPLDVSQRVIVLADGILPSSGGAWSLCRTVLDALSRRSEALPFKLVAVVNRSFADLADRYNRASCRWVFVEDMRRTQRALWFQGGHSNWLLLDRMRDWGGRRFGYPSFLIPRSCYYRDMGVRPGDVLFVPKPNFRPGPPPLGVRYVQQALDFQYEYYPENFSADVVAYRRNVEGGYLREADALVIMGEHVRKDLARFLNVPSERVFTAPMGPPSLDGPLAECDVQSVCSRYGIPKRFLFYPARPWRHKNHIRLLQALSRARETFPDVGLVCTATEEPFFQEVEREMERLSLKGSVMFTGSLPQADLIAIFRASESVVIPTLFEADTGIPLLEAMALGKPIAASSVCGIPEALGDCGLLFDPLSTEEIAEAIIRLWSSVELRRDLGDRALKRCSQRSWDDFVDGYVKAFQYAASLAKPSLGRSMLRHTNDQRLW